MTCCNRFRIHYLLSDILVSLLSVLIPYIILYEHSRLTFLALYMTWVYYELYERFKLWIPYKYITCSQPIHRHRQSTCHHNWQDDITISNMINHC